MSWKRLQYDLAEWLSKVRPAGTEYRNPYQAIVGLSSDSFRSDGMITDGRTLLAIEVEAGQPHPDTNVGKYWFLFDKHHYDRIVLFHVYTPVFDSYTSRKELAAFYETKMTQGQVPIQIHRIELPSTASYARTLKSLKDMIWKCIKANFASIN